MDDSEKVDTKQLISALIATGIELMVGMVFGPVGVLVYKLGEAIYNAGLLDHVRKFLNRVKAKAKSKGLTRSKFCAQPLLSTMIYFFG